MKWLALLAVILFVVGCSGGEPNPPTEDEDGPAQKETEIRSTTTSGVIRSELHSSGDLTPNNLAIGFGSIRSMAGSGDYVDIRQLNGNPFLSTATLQFTPVPDYPDQITFAPTGSSDIFVTYDYEQNWNVRLGDHNNVTVEYGDHSIVLTSATLLNKLR